MASLEVWPISRYGPFQGPYQVARGSLHSQLLCNNELRSEPAVFDVCLPIYIAAACFLDGNESPYSSLERVRRKLLVC